MNWDAIGAVGELIGATAVLVTLIYLATQIKQTNKMARFETTREITGQFNACNHLYATDTAIRQVLLKKGELSEDEAERLYSYVDLYCNAFATAQLAFDQGLVDDAVWAVTVRDIEVALNRWPNMRQAVERWFSNYPEFKDSEFFKAIEHH